MARRARLATEKRLARLEEMIRLATTPRRETELTRDQVAEILAGLEAAMGTEGLHIWLTERVGAELAGDIVTAATPRRRSEIGGADSPAEVPQAALL